VIASKKYLEECSMRNTKRHTRMFHEEHGETKKEKGI